MALGGNDPSQVFNQMMQTNPQFREFANFCQGKTPEEVMMALSRR